MTQRATADIRARVRHGDLTALTDPALPLHLLAEGPESWWWLDVVWCGARRCIEACVLAMPRPYEAAVVLVQWSVPLVDAHPLCNWYRFRCHVDRVLKSDGPAEAAFYVDEAICCVALDMDEVEINRVTLALAREVRSLLPSAPAELDAALAVLEQYVS
jgi:hypothetical protein